MGVSRKLYGTLAVHQRSSSHARQLTFLANTRIMSFLSIISLKSFIVKVFMLLGSEIGEEPGIAYPCSISALCTTNRHKIRRIYISI